MGQSQQPAPNERAHAEAVNIMNAAGVRGFVKNGVFTLGVWSDLDCRELRTALAILGYEKTPVVYLDGPDVPMRFKVRRVPLKTTAMTWDQWKADALNRLFTRRGEPAKITANTVRHGRLNTRRKGLDI